MKKFNTCVGLAYIFAVVLLSTVSLSACSKKVVSEAEILTAITNCQAKMMGPMNADINGNVSAEEKAAIEQAIKESQAAGNKLGGEMCEQAVRQVCNSDAAKCQEVLANYK
jgi:acyl CoA:acetate/3-ketoacid CoA transferase